MLELKDDNWKLLPKKIQKRVNDFLEHLKEITWFIPSKDLKKSDVDKQAKFILKCFGIKAKIEYRKLETKKVWGSVYSSTWRSAYKSVWVLIWDLVCKLDWNVAWLLVWDLVRILIWNLAKKSVRDLFKKSTYDLAWDAVRASMELLVIENKDFKEKYPNWAFTQLFKLWEMGLYPVWILKKNKKFVIYADPKYLLKKNWWFK